MSLESLTKEDLQSLVNMMWRINENVSDKLFDLYNEDQITREQYYEFKQLWIDQEKDATPNALAYIERRADQEARGH